MGYYSGTTGKLLGYHRILLEFQRSDTRVLLDKHRNTSGVLLWYYWGRGGLSKILLGYC